jgi:hypothetical protein
LIKPKQQSQEQPVILNWRFLQMITLLWQSFGLIE